MVKAYLYINRQHFQWFNIAPRKVKSCNRHCFNDHYRQLYTEEPVDGFLNDIFTSYLHKVSDVAYQWVEAYIYIYIKHSPLSFKAARPQTGWEHLGGTILGCTESKIFPQSDGRINFSSTRSISQSPPSPNYYCTIFHGPEEFVINGVYCNMNEV